MFGCHEVTELADAFIDGEYLAGAWMQIRLHMQACLSCADFIEEKRWLKNRVRAAVKGLSVPTTLGPRIQKRIGA